MSITSAFGMTGASAKTFTLWTKQNVALTSDQSDIYFRHLYGGSANGNYANVGYRNNGGTLQATMPTSPGGMYVDYTFTVDEWFYQRVTVPASNSGNIALFTNAVSVGTTANWSQNYGLTTTLGILADHGPGDHSPVSVDEFRIMSGIQTDNWTTTEYNNQNAESTFWGTWTDAGGSPSPIAHILQMI